MPKTRFNGTIVQFSKQSSFFILRPTTKRTVTTIGVDEYDVPYKSSYPEDNEYAEFMREHIKDVEQSDLESAIRGGYWNEGML